MQTLIQTESGSQGLVLSFVDRRALLRASLRLYLRRLSHGFAVSADDLIRLAPYADPPAATA